MGRNNLVQIRRFGDLVLEIVLTPDYKIESASVKTPNGDTAVLDEKALSDFSGFLGDFLYYTAKSRDQAASGSPFDQVFDLS